MEVDGQDEPTLFVSISHLPQLDKRIGARNPEYLKDLIHDPTDPKAIWIEQPLTCFPKGFFASENGLNILIPELHSCVVILQGNNRMEAVQRVVDSDLQETEENRHVYHPMKVRELNDTQANSPEVVGWLQSAINDGVLATSPLERVKGCLNFMHYLTDHFKNIDEKVLYEKTAASQGISVSRLKEYVYFVSNANQLMIDWLTNEVASFSSLSYLLSVFNSLVRSGYDEGLDEFTCGLTQHITVDTSRGMKITPKVIDEFANLIKMQLPSQESTEELPLNEGNLEDSETDADSNFESDTEVENAVNEKAEKSLDQALIKFKNEFDEEKLIQAQEAIFSLTSLIPQWSFLKTLKEDYSSR
ncbi:hypothetical protein HC928_04185 [bacterium]|nr:hypothetical protein [bacterium]